MYAGCKCMWKAALAFSYSIILKYGTCSFLWFCDVSAAILCVVAVIVAVAVMIAARHNA